MILAISIERVVTKNSRLLLVFSLAISLIVLWYVDWLLPNVHLGPLAALPLFLLGYRIGLWPTLALAGAAAIGLALADADYGSTGSHARISDVIIDSAMLLVAFGIAAFAADFARRRADEIATLRSRVARERSRAETDLVTNLPNRVHFERQLDLAASGRAREHLMGIVVADLDNFKQINDRCGHRTGDLVLAEAARRLESSVRKSDTVARIGGDEFGLILRGVESAEEVRLVCDKVRCAFAEPLALRSGSLLIGLSLGYSICPDDGDDLRSLVDIADRRMYEAKHAVRVPAATSESFG